MDQANQLNELMRAAPRPVRHQNDEVYYAVDGVRTVSAADIAWLKNIADCVPRHRARLCLHSAIDDPVHEMIIVNRGDCFVPPHAHPFKEESMLVIEGVARVPFFDADGHIERIVTMAAPGNVTAAGEAASYFYRLPKNQFHGLRIDSDWFVFHETASGPFRPDGNIFPPWVPLGMSESDGLSWLDAAIARGSAAQQVSG